MTLAENNKIAKSMIFNDLVLLRRLFASLLENKGTSGPLPYGALSK
jgi:hypothetical protein